MQPLAIVHDYRELIVALRQRREALDLPYSTIDDIAGLPTAYASKLLAMRPGRSLGKISLGLILATLGLKLAVLEDEEALSKVRGRFTKRRRTSRTVSIQMGARVKGVVPAAAPRPPRPRSTAPASAG